MAPSANGLNVPNGNHTLPKRPFTDGVYCPLVTPFKSETQELDYDALTKQVVRLASAKMGIVLLGTNGEAIHLSDHERRQVISASRHALDSAGFTSVPLLVGTGTGSAKETIRLCVEAAHEGADYVIVIPPGYFAFVIGKDKATIKGFFEEVFEGSPLPVMIYNFPGAASGIDLDSDLLIELSNHPNCFGAKLTCAGVGKGHRLALHTSSPSYLKAHSTTKPNGFFVLPGFSDILLPSMMVRMRGTITGTGNVIPKTIVKLYELCEKVLNGEGGKSAIDECMKVQDLVTLADWAIIKAGIGGTKWAMDEYIEKGLGGVPRSPLPYVDESVKKMLSTDLKDALEYEKSL